MEGDLKVIGTVCESGDDLKVGLGRAEDWEAVMTSSHAKVGLTIFTADVVNVLEAKIIHRIQGILLEVSALSIIAGDGTIVLPEYEVRREDLEEGVGRSMVYIVAANEDVSDETD